MTPPVDPDKIAPTTSSQPAWLNNQISKAELKGLRWDKVNNRWVVAKQVGLIDFLSYKVGLSKNKTPVRMNTQAKVIAYSSLALVVVITIVMINRSRNKR